MPGSKDMTASWRLRGYVVERLLGGGSSGDVWFGRVRTTGEAVALKRLSVPNPESARRASAEAAKLTVLDHPHLVRLHAYVPDHDVAVLVLDLADAGSLAELLDARGRLTPGELITALAPIAAALAYIHAAGVIHGDVSAANVLFTGAGLPLLADLGVSRLFGDLDDVSSTPAYVDPLVAGGGVPGPHSDVFMLGAVALHALTGRPLWVGDADAALAEAGDAVACDARLARVASLLAEADTPPAMAAVIRRALELDPVRRGSAAELALDLRHSGTPVAVELTAGRERSDPISPSADVGVPPAPTETRPRGGRHAAPTVRPARATWTSGRSRSALRSQAAVARISAAAARPTVDPRPVVPSDRSRPAFDRPSFDRSAPPPDGPLSPPDGPLSPPDGPLSPPDGLVNSPDGPGIGRPPPTNAVARPRPAIPQPRRRIRLLTQRRAGRRSVARRSVAVAGGAAMALVAAALGGALWMRTGRPTPALAAAPVAAAPVAAAREAASTAAARPAMSKAATPSSSTPSASSPAVPHRHPSPDWSVALQQLDARRARAFATRNPRLLRQVYVNGPLLETDAALLRRIVPRDCRLIGVHTRYGPVSTRVHGHSVLVTVRGTLMPSQLECPGRLDRRARSVGPTRLRITLVNSSTGLLIADEQILS